MLPPIFNQDRQKQQLQQGLPQRPGQPVPLQPGTPRAATPQRAPQRPEQPGPTRQPGSTRLPQPTAAIPAGILQSLAGQPKQKSATSEQSNQQGNHTKQVLSLIEKLIAGGLIARA